MSEAKKKIEKAELAKTVELAEQLKFADIRRAGYFPLYINTKIIVYLDCVKVLLAKLNVIFFLS